MKKALLTLITLPILLAVSCGESVQESTGNSDSSISSEEPSSASVESLPASSSSEEKMKKTDIAYTYYDFGKGNVSLKTNCPSIGSPKILVIPVWFTDSSTYLPSDAYRENVRKDIESTFFGTPEETGWHSVSSFYAEESQDQLTFSGTVSSSWYESGKSMSEAGSSMTVTWEIVLSAAEWYFANNPDEDRASYDLDKDGYLDCVSLIYAAPDRQALEDESLSNLWAYCNWLSSVVPSSLEKPNVGTYFWASYDFMYSKDTAKERTGSSYQNGSTDGLEAANPVDAHTFIHEFGHVLGLDDYYDVNGQYNPAAGFSMEDANVGGHEPFSTMALGWSDPYIPTESVSLTIGAFQTTREFILLTPGWNQLNSPFDEYLLLELYTPTGLNELDTEYQYQGASPQGMDETGIRLWHIDARLAKVIIGEDYSYSLGDPTSDPYPVGWKVSNAFTNTYYLEGGSSNNYCSIYGQDYSDYNLIQLIHNDKQATYRPTDNMDADDLFGNGDSFSIDDYSSQFVKGDKLNDGRPLGWSFSVSISGEGENAKATINLVRE